ncbi:MAG: Xaa-Pro peptidase family protein [candidate division Zixibacteria bacterium]|nr:Xaa-Pro peptidase family protein [candidate division Zixibacteria bacterium]
MSTTRLNALRKSLHEQNLDGLIVINRNQVRYLTGFYGHEDMDGYLVMSGSQVVLFTDSRYTDYAKKVVRGARVEIVTGAKIAALKEHSEFGRQNLRLGYHNGTMTVAILEQIESTLPDCLMISADKVFAELGWVKDHGELASITKAVRIADVAYERILCMVAPGIRERDLAAELEYQMSVLGSEKPAFESAVVSGYRSAMPHGLPTSKKLEKGDFVTFDFGATVDGYLCDITRTVVVGKATNRQKKIYDTVLRAQLAAIRKIKAGASGRAVDKTARDIITKAGYGKNFGHGTGHGISMEIHSGPSLSPRVDNKLKAGNVITVEPGIYISGWGGVRIEDDVVVTRTGCRVLNQAPKKLLEL